MNSIIESMGTAAGKDPATTLKDSDLNWTVCEDKVAGMDTAIQMPRRKLLYRSDTKVALGITGEDYAPTNPADFMAEQFRLAEALHGRVARAGFISERSRCFAFVEMDEALTLPKNLRSKGDPMRAYIYSTDGWDGGTPRKARLYLERVVCSNGMTSSEIRARMWVSHTQGMETRIQPRAKSFEAVVQSTLKEMRERFIAIAKQNMDKAGCLEFLVKLMPGESPQATNRREKILNLFENGVGNEGRSRWDAFNAVTEYVTHHRSYRETDGTPVAVNRFLGVLETDTLVPRAMEMLAN